MKKERNNKSTNSKKKEKRITKMFFGLGLILVVVFIGLILFNFGVFEKGKEIIKFSLDDECSIIMGNLIHNIRDNGDCKIKCINNCKIRKLDFYDVEFALQNSSCHICDCYCR